MNLPKTLDTKSAVTRLALALWHEMQFPDEYHRLSEDDRNTDVASCISQALTILDLPDRMDDDLGEIYEAVHEELGK
jgi:hypothetical protein